MYNVILGHLNGFDSTYFLKGIVNRYGGGFLFKNTSNDPSGRPKRNLFHEKIVRIRDPRGCKMEICWHQSNGRTCKIGETCHFAHSHIELELWLLLTSTKLSAQQLVHFTETGSISVKRKINQVNQRDVDIPPINLLVQSASLLCSKVREKIGKFFCQFWEFHYSRWIRFFGQSAFSMDRTYRSMRISGFRDSQNWQ